MSLSYFSGVGFQPLCNGFQNSNNPCGWKGSASTVSLRSSNPNADLRSKLRNLKAAATEISGQGPEPSSATAMIELARWAGFEETARWQSRVAWTLLSHNHPEEAIKFCQKAIDGGLKDAQTLRCLSLAYSTNKDEDKALETAKLSVAVASGEDVERTMAQLLFCELRTGRLDESIATFHQYLDEVDKSDEASREVYYFINELLDSSYSRKNEEVLETIKRMVDVQRSVEFFLPVGPEH